MAVYGFAWHLASHCFSYRDLIVRMLYIANLLKVIYHTRDLGRAVAPIPALDSLFPVLNHGAYTDVTQTSLLSDAILRISEHGPPTYLGIYPDEVRRFSRIRLSTKRPANENKEVKARKVKMKKSEIGDFQSGEYLKKPDRLTVDATPGMRFKDS